MTLVLLDVRMGLQVGAEVGAVSKGSAAVGAGVGLLAWKRNANQGLGTDPQAVSGLV